MQMATRTQKMVFTALMAALLAIAAPFTIPIGPVPFTLAFFCVFFIGLMLPPLPACVALTVYMLLGFVGLPVFSGFRAGPQVLFGPTGGYLLGYYCMVLATAIAAKRTQSMPVRFAMMMAGMAACYLLGTLWFMFIMKAGFVESLALCVLPFVIPDVIKAVAALVLARLLQSRLMKGRSGA